MELPPLFVQVADVMVQEGQLSDLTPVMHLIVVLHSGSPQIDPGLMHLVRKWWFEGFMSGIALIGAKPNENELILQCHMPVDKLFSTIFLSSRGHFSFKQIQQLHQYCGFFSLKLFLSVQVHKSAAQVVGSYSGWIHNFPTAVLPLL
jgi:hypothetical protein